MKKLITARDIEDIRRSRGHIVVARDVIITPSARDLIRQFHIQLLYEDPEKQALQSRQRAQVIHLAASIPGADALTRLRRFWHALDYEVINLGHLPDARARQDELAGLQLPGFLLFIASDGFAETVWLNKKTHFTAVRCCNAVEAEAARLEVDADILVIPSDYLGWKLALKTAHRFVTTAHVSPQKKHGEKDG
jgi:hypothetical protein